MRAGVGGSWGGYQRKSKWTRPENFLPASAKVFDVTCESAMILNYVFQFVKHRLDNINF